MPKVQRFRSVARMTFMWGQRMKSWRYILAGPSALLILLAVSLAPPALGQDAPSLKSQFETARTAADWKGMEAAARQLVAAEPKNWEYQGALADALYNQGKYAEAALSYQAAISLAGGSPNDDAKRAVGRMLMSEGNANIKLRNYDAAILLFEKAARTDPNPATAYFNLCATEYNLAQLGPAEASCDKAIQYDPKRADLYFIKGSILVGNAAVKPGGKMAFSPGAAPALRKYLELAPAGGHADDAKQMLDFIEQNNSK